MSVAIGKAGFSGDLTLKVNRTKAPLSWKIKNTLRPAYINGYVGKKVADIATKYLPITAITSELAVRKFDYESGMWVDYGIVGRKVVTTAAAELICDAFQGTAMPDWYYHGLGSGSTAENVTDTALEVEFTTEYLADSTRAAGTQTEQAASPQVYESVATNTVDAVAIAREHGILNWQDSSGGSLLDRTVFAEINLSASDAIQSTYRLTVQAGG